MSLSDRNPEQSGGAWSPLRILIIVSLALNMFFLGAGAVLLGRSVLHREPPPGFPMMGRSEFVAPGAMLRALPPEARERVNKAVADERAKMREAVKAARLARKEAYEAFIAEPYSAETYQRKSAASLAADLAAVNAVHALIARVEATLTPEERTALAKELKEHPPRPRHGRDDGPPDMPPAGASSPDGSPADAGPPPAP